MPDQCCAHVGWNETDLMLDHTSFAGELVAAYSLLPLVRDVVTGAQPGYWPAPVWIQASYAIVLLIAAAFWVFKSGVWWAMDHLPLTVSVMVAMAFLAHRWCAARAIQVRLPPARCWPTSRDGQGKA